MSISVGRVINSKLFLENLQLSLCSWCCYPNILADSFIKCTMQEKKCFKLIFQKISTEKWSLMCQINSLIYFRNARYTRNILWKNTRERLKSSQPEWFQNHSDIWSFGQIWRSRSGWELSTPQKEYFLTFLANYTCDEDWRTIQPNC